MPVAFSAVFVFAGGALSMRAAPFVAFVALSVLSVLLATPCATVVAASLATAVSSFAGFWFPSVVEEAPVEAAE